MKQTRVKVLKDKAEKKVPLPEPMQPLPEPEPNIEIWRRFSIQIAINYD